MRGIAAHLAGMALIAFAAPAAAQESGPYIAADAGAVLPVEFNSDIAGVREDATSTGKTGWGASLRAGYRWDWLRTELEGSYQHCGADEISVATQGLPAGGESLANGSFPYGGDFSLASLMANTLAEFGEEDGARFAIGGGVGRCWLQGDTALAGSTIAYLDARDSEWAWQALAEARLPVNEGVDLGLRYRYFSTLEFEVDDSLGRDTQFELATHSLSLGLTVRFGGGREASTIQPSAPPVAAIAPAPVRRPPPGPRLPPPVPCETGPYIVYFDWDEAAITIEAAQVLDSVIRAYANCGNVSVMLAGHADRSGPQGYNVTLSQRRNAAVRTYLADRGVPGNMMAAEAHGETRSRVPTGDGVREAQNRRVEIMFGPGSGS